jgi:hypothetical protein
MAILDHDYILLLCQEAIDVGLASTGKRNALLATLPDEFVAALRAGQTPQEQLLLDLESLNNLEGLPEEKGSIPLAQWLDNAALFSRLQKQEETFKDASARVKRAFAAVSPVPSPRAPASLWGLVGDGLELLSWLLLWPERWSAAVARVSPALPADFSLSHLALRWRRAEAELVRFCHRCLAGAGVALLGAAMIPVLFACLRHDYHLVRHALCVAAMAASIGAGISVGGSIAAGMAASTVGALVGATTATVEVLLGEPQGWLGIGGSGGAALGAAAVVSLAIGRVPLARVPCPRKLRLGPAVLPMAVGGAIVATLCVVGFLLSQNPGLTHAWNAADPGPVFGAGAGAGAALGVFISVPGWARLRILPGVSDRLSPLVYWIGVPLLAGALLAWCAAGATLDDWHPIRGLAIGTLTGAVIAAAFACTYALLSLMMDSRRGLAASALAVAATAVLVLVRFRTFRYLTGPGLTAVGGLGGLVIALLLGKIALRLSRRETPAPSSPLQQHDGP